MGRPPSCSHMCCQRIGTAAASRVRPKRFPPVLPQAAVSASAQTYSPVAVDRAARDAGRSLLPSDHPLPVRPNAVFRDVNLRRPRGECASGRASVLRPRRSSEPAQRPRHICEGPPLPAAARGRRHGFGPPSYCEMSRWLLPRRAADRIVAGSIVLGWNQYKECVRSGQKADERVLNTQKLEKQAEPPRYPNNRHQTRDVCATMSQASYHSMRLSDEE